MTADQELFPAQHFADRSDPRIDRSWLHKLLDVIALALAIAICAVVAGADSGRHRGLRQAQARLAGDLPGPAHSPFPSAFAYDGGKSGAGSKGTLSINGERVAEGRIEHTHGYLFSGDETADVGMDDATPVTEDYKERENQFTGKIGKVTVDLK